MIKKIFAINILLLITYACSNNPQPIEYNKDECAHCLMIISDPKFGSELITDKGKVYKFDSIECLADYISIEREFQYETLWITDFSNPHHLIDATTAHYIVSPKMESPMSMNIGGFEDQNNMEKVFAEMGGQKMNWDDIKSYVKNYN